MAESDRLRRLHVGEARHDDGSVLDRLLRERKLKARDLAVEVVDGAANVKPEIGSDLVVARPRRMKLARDRADQLLQPRFHRHVDVFILAPELEASTFDLFAHGVETGDDLPGLGFGQNTAGAQHLGVGLACADVLGIETLVERNGGVDLLHDLGGLRLKAPAPHFIGHRCHRLRGLKAKH